MSLGGRFNKLARKVVDSKFQIRAETYKNTSRLTNKKIKTDSIFVNAINLTEEDVEPYNCVRVLDGVDESSILSFVYPEGDDEEENSIYGSLQNFSPSEHMGIIQLSGPGLLRIYKGTDLINVGEKLYPLPNELLTKGLISNLNSGQSIIGNGFCRSLQKEGDNTVIVETFLGGVGGGGASDYKYAYAASTDTTHPLNGLTPTTGHDDVTLVENNLVLVWNQDTSGNNGIYKAKELTDWQKVKSFDSEDDIGKIITIGKGSFYGKKMFVVTAINTIELVNNDHMFVQAATTANMSSISGLTNVDSASPAIAAGSLILLWKQTSPSDSNHGIYMAASGFWTKIRSFTDADKGRQISVASGTLYGKLNFVVTAANTVTPMGAVFL